MKEGFYSVKWAVYFQGLQRYYASGQVISTKEVKFLKLNKILTGRVKDDELRALWHKIYGDGYYDELAGKDKPSVLSQGQKAMSQIEEYFSFDLFLRIISGDYTAPDKEKYSDDLIEALKQRSDRLRADEKIGNADLFKSTAFSFTKFAVFKKVTKANNPKLPFPIVTALFLKDYEKWMLTSGKSGQATGSKDSPTPGKDKPASITMVGIYTRNVRTIFNEAISEKVVSKENYPFGKGGYRIPKANNKKKALDDLVLYHIFNFKCKEKSERDRYHSLWLFSYLSNGINVTDICNIKRKNVTDTSIEIYRAKTEESKKENLEKIIIPITKEITGIIGKWGNEDQSDEAYLFDFLQCSMTAQKKKAKVKAVIKSINHHMGNIAEEISKLVGYPVSIKTMEARHSFATTLVRSEAPLAFISEMLGHGTIKTTQNYIGSFEDVKKKSYLSALIPKKPTETNQGPEAPTL